MVFNCNECGRCLPDFMEKERNRCSECITGELHKTGTRNSKKSNRKNTRPEVVNISNGQETSSAENNIPDKNNYSNDDSATSSSVSQASIQPSTEPTAQIYFKITPPDQFSDLYCCDVFCMGWYDREDYKSDPFSNKIIKYCKRERTDQKEYFLNQLDGFITTRLQDRIEADLITIYPGSDGDISEGLIDLANQLEKEYPVEYKQLLERTEPRPPQKEQGANRWKNQYGSIGVKEQLDGEFVLLLDDVVTSGASVTVGTTELLKAGATDVVVIGLGASDNQDQICEIFTKPTPTVQEVINNE